MSNSVAIMQPYLFPYIGYFKLIHAVDKFVFYDDVNFIKGGWIHRNKLLVNNKENLFTIPLTKPSSFIKIKDTKLNTKIYKIWVLKFYKTLQQSYSRAPFYNEVLQILDKVFKEDVSNNIGDFASKSILEVCNYLDFKKKWYYSSKNFNDTQDIGRTERLIHMSKLLNCDTYINTIGGERLYSIDDFLKENLTLKFLSIKQDVYKQFSNEFIPNLSIIDVLMFNSKDQVKKLLTNYSFV